jgi:hypothetical protein
MALPNFSKLVGKFNASLYRFHHVGANFMDDNYIIPGW